MLNMLKYYHNKSISTPNKHNRYQLVYDGKNMLADNPQPLSWAMPAFYEVPCLLNKATVNIAIVHLDLAHEGRFLMLNRLYNKNLLNIERVLSTELTSLL